MPQRGRPSNDSERINTIKKRVRILLILFIGTIAIPIGYLLYFNTFTFNDNNGKLKDLQENANGKLKDLQENANGKLKDLQENYTKFISNSDKDTLKQLIKEYYPLYQGLYEIGYNIIQNNKSDLQLKNLTLISAADKKAQCENMPTNNTKCIQYDPPYGIDSNTETAMRHLVGSTINEFKNRYNNNYHEYSFIATPDCNMYLLEPYSKQQSLVSGNYTSHPWCIELKNNYFGGRAYATETYLTKNQLVPWSTIAFPIKQSYNNINNVFFGLGLNLYHMTQNFFTNHSLPDTSKLFLVSTHVAGKNNFTRISEPGRYPGRYEPVENTPLTSLTTQEQANLKQEINTFDKDEKISNIQIGAKNYFISATSNNLNVIDNQNNKLDPRYPISDNRDRGVSWEWVLLRESPSSNMYPINEKTYSINEKTIPSPVINTATIIIILLILLSVYIVYSIKTLLLKKDLKGSETSQQI
jgi:hypothetical protein